jgi:hypothetical protein
MYSPSRHSPLVFVPNEGQGPAIELQRLELGGSPEDRRREEFLQELVHTHPEIIPMKDIEPAFTPLVSICRELETPAGFVDNFWLTPAGGIVLGECKRVRNPQSRREAITQALDYARAICSWNYEELQRSFRKSAGADATLYDTVKEKAGLTELDEEQFVDAVERRLRASRLMTLVIGDGIQEGAEALTTFLQLHAGLRVGIALVDLSIWQGLNGGWVIAPRVPLKTVIVERGVVVIGPTGQINIEPPAVDKTGKPRASTASEAEFFDQMEQRRPGLSGQVKSFIEGLLDIGISPEFRKALVLRWQPSADLVGSLGYIESTGKVWTGDACGTAKRLNKPAAGDEYLQAVARAVGGTVRHDHVLGADGRIVDVAALLAHGDAWKQAITQFVSATKPVNN